MEQVLDQLYFMDDRSQEIHALVDTYRDFLTDNLEHFLIGTSTSVEWPSEIKAKIADTIVHGRLSYLNENDRCCRVLHLETLTTGSAGEWKPLPYDPDAEGAAQKSVLCEAVRAALDTVLEEDVFDISSNSCVDTMRAAATEAFVYEADAASRLGGIASVIRDVFLHSARPVRETVDILFTSITGFPCILDGDSVDGDLHFGCNIDYKKRTSYWLNLLVGPLARQTFKVTTICNAMPGRRWKMSITTKMAYVDKLCQQEGRLSATWEMVQTLSKLDEAHIVLEQGLAFKACGMKICYLGPAELAQTVMYSIADVYQAREDAAFRAGDATSRTSFRLLVAGDIDVMRETENTEKFGKWISLPPDAFSRETLRNFVGREEKLWLRVATNRFGDCMFFVDDFGPWMFSDTENTATHLSMPMSTFLYETVHGYPHHVVSNHWWKTKKDAHTVPYEPEEPAKNYAFQPLKYKPSTINAIINKPRRVLVRRKGLRGNSGRVIVAVLLIVGILAMHFNWADRNNMLERIFDATQLMSLGAAVFVAVIYVWKKTLTSTLDWLRGVTEVTDDKQLSKCLGVCAEEVKIATTFEHESLFWLSDKNSSFCPGIQLGDLVFSEPLSLNIKSPHVLGGCVVEKDRGLWILQGWAFRIEHGENAERLVRVPFEDTVYMGRRDKRPEVF